jgi:ubiquitin-conjugating enzyme E2 G1
MKAINVILRNRDIFEKDPIDGVSIGYDDENVFKWYITIIGPKDSPYEGGIFKAEMIFPKNYPLYPPEFKFINNIFHPNIFENGTVCISILHPPGEDKYNEQETADMRWRPVHTATSIILSIISLLSAPNDESPANIDAAKVWRDDNKKFLQLVNNCVRESLI